MQENLHERQHFSAEDSQELPVGWSWARLEDVALINPKGMGEKIQDNLTVSFVPMKDVEELKGVIHLSNVKKYKEVKKGYTPFVNGDIIFAKITPCMENGKIAIANDLENGIGFGSTEFHVIRLIDRNFSQKFLLYYLLQKKFRIEAHRNMTGSAGQLRVPVDFMKRVLVPIPPLAEQKRIATKIEKLFTALDSYVESLMKTQMLLKLYRTSVLQYAVEGKLTQEWRRTHKVEPVHVLIEQILKKRNMNMEKCYESLSDVGLPELPTGWLWTRIGCIYEVIMGQSPSGGSYNTEGKGIPLLNGPTEFGLNNPSPIQWTTSPTKICEKDDLLICVRGSTTGKINWSDQRYCIGRGLAAIRPYSLELNLEFLYYFLKIKTYELMKYTTGSTFPNLKSNELREFIFPLAPAAEQNVIAEEIKHRLSVMDNIENGINYGLEESDILRQSILNQAFDGKLVQPDPTDECA